ncbi:hypothetical protein PVAG01_08588 [Phlyctema vagabunda]|uniref:Uncharacterized protein n=1 Tax=Phlyctema vagabunda TaxID=108571 RepID=A0ABR4P9X6_9HELO
MAFMKFAKWNPLSQPQAYEPVEGGTAHLPLKRENKKSRSLAGRLLLSPVLSVVSMGFIIANIGSYMVMNQRIDFLKHFCPDLPYSPEVTGFRFSHMVMDLYSYDPYKDYGKESDRAWDNLLDKQYFRATKEEMIAWGEFDENSIELEDGGYVAQLRLFRELQCLVKPFIPIRQLLAYCLSQLKDFIKRQYGNPAVRAVTNFTEADKGSSTLQRGYGLLTVYRPLPQCVAPGNAMSRRHNSFGLVHQRGGPVKASHKSIARSPCLR